MVQIINASNRSRCVATIESMHRDRKTIFVDHMRWKIPVQGDLEVDQFDDDLAEYLVAADEVTGEHMGSMRLLRTDRPHILGSLFPQLCEMGVPTGPSLREITRLCLSPRLKTLERRATFLRLTTALVEYAQLSGITSYTAVTDMRWLSETLSVGWRCMPLGMPQVLDGPMVCAMQITIDASTIPAMKAAGTYRDSGLRLPHPQLADAA